MDRLISGNGRFALIMQDDGNLVAYDNGTPYWASNTVVDDDPPDPPDPLGPLPRLVVRGQFFAQENVGPWTAIQCSEFNLLNRWQHGEDIAPLLAQRRGAGYTLLRVWTLYDLEAAGIGRFLDIDYTRIPAFLDLCASWGFYVEFTAYTSLERPDHWDRLCDACRPCTNVLVELVNEGTLPVNQIDMTRYAKPAGVLASHGSGGAEGVPPWEPWDYITFHTNGAFEEQRKVGHNAMADCADPTGRPALTNETSRYPDVGMWRGSGLARQQQLAFDSAAGAALLCAGSCFHSVAGKRSVLWDPDTETVARAWAAGARSVPLACQPGPYRRRDDLLEPGLLRVYQRGTSDACIVKIRE